MRKPTRSTLLSLSALALCLAQAVPEPGTWALMAAGLARRRGAYSKG
jgi:hypothetical protein